MDEDEGEGDDGDDGGNKGMNALNEDGQADDFDKLKSIVRNEETEVEGKKESIELELNTPQTRSRQAAEGNETDATKTMADEQPSEANAAETKGDLENVVNQLADEEFEQSVNARCSCREGGSSHSQNPQENKNKNKLINERLLA